MLGVTVPGFGLSDAEARKAALDALASLDMADLQGRSYVHLSGGERQRVHIARALCQLAMPAWRSGADALLPARRADRQPRPRASDARCWRPCAGRRSAAMPCWPCCTTSTWPPRWPTTSSCSPAPRWWPPDRRAEVLRDDLLSDAYGCPVRTNQTPQGDRPFVLPPAVFATEATRATRSLPERGRRPCVGKLGLDSNCGLHWRNSNVG